MPVRCIGCLELLSRLDGMHSGSHNAHTVAYRHSWVSCSDAVRVPAGVAALHSALHPCQRASAQVMSSDPFLGLIWYETSS